MRHLDIFLIIRLIWPSGWQIKATGSRYPPPETLSCGTKLVNSPHPLILAPCPPGAKPTRLPRAKAQLLPNPHLRGTTLYIWAYGEKTATVAVRCLSQQDTRQLSPWTTMEKWDRQNGQL